MDGTARPILALAFVFLVLLGLFLVHPSFEKGNSLFAENTSTVSELGLRFSFQR
jgi:hypothetical protein